MKAVMFSMDELDREAATPESLSGQHGEGQYVPLSRFKDLTLGDWPRPAPDHIFNTFGVPPRLAAPMTAGESQTIAYEVSIS